jgi:hypothetical protein
VLSGRGLCDEPITRPEEYYRLRCVIVCDLENLKNGEAMNRVGSQRHRKKKNLLCVGFGFAIGSGRVLIVLAASGRCF